MKNRIICFIILASLVFNTIPASMQGASLEELFDSTNILNIVSFSDGSQLIEMKPIINRANSSSITGSKNYYYLDGDGNISWDAVITGTFTFNGTTSYCTASSCTTPAPTTAFPMRTFRIPRWRMQRCFISAIRL